MNRQNKEDSVEALEVPFLQWSGVKFTWDGSPGDTVNTKYESGFCRRFRDYMSKLSTWTYSLTGSRLDYGTIGRYFKKSKLDCFDLQRDVFCQNRYRKPLALTLWLYFQDLELGPLTLLPEISLDGNQTIQLVLSCIGIESDLPEPEWLDGFNVPGQEKFDSDIERIEAQCGTLKNELVMAHEKRTKCRECLKLLYEREYALEPVVRDILNGLGAYVEDPKEKGKEDGWIVVSVGDKTYEGVLEIKSTRRDQFGEDGRKQLLEWIDRGRIQRHKNYKGVFIGNSAVDKPVGERPDAFSDNWRKAAELSGICALKTEHLYAFYVLKKSGKIEMDEIWRIIFESNGVLNFDKYLAYLNS